jgi:hypothetical protein
MYLYYTVSVPVFLTLSSQCVVHQSAVYECPILASPLAVCLPCGSLQASA